MVTITNIDEINCQLFYSDLSKSDTLTSQILLWQEAKRNKEMMHVQVHYTGYNDAHTKAIYLLRSLRDINVTSIVVCPVCPHSRTSNLNVH